MSRAYYNEFDPKAAAWLRELIKSGLIADGDVDERSITEVSPQDLTSYAQCHFFAGIGGWSYALRLAGVPDGLPVWTGSCPCQPFSAAGKGLAERDERHLWPVFCELIRACNPSVVFGEQVASKAALGWLDSVFDDLEGAGYSCGASDLCAAGVGAPHVRQRIYWMAHSELSSIRLQKRGAIEAEKRGVQGSNRERQRVWVNPWTISGFESQPVVQCGDGKIRRIKSGISILADGFPGRLGLLRGYGNAIVPQLAAEFIQASLQAIEDLKAA